jgi:magnesium-transporting ATPase (P-type)
LKIAYCKKNKNNKSETINPIKFYSLLKAFLIWSVFNKFQENKLTAENITLLLLLLLLLLALLSVEFNFIQCNVSVIDIQYRNIKCSSQKGTEDVFLYRTKKVETLQELI